MSWQLHVPHTALDQTPAEALVANADAKLEGEERTVAAQLLLDASIDSEIATIGDLVDRIERLDPAGRRRLLDRTREAAGLVSASDVEALERFTAANEQLARRPRPPLPRCPICNVTPTTAEGFPDPMAAAGVKRWHCEEHRDQAAPGDLDPPPSGIGLDMRFIPDPDEVERGRHEDERRAERDRQRRADREAEAEATRVARERYIEANKDNPYVNPLSGTGWAGKT